MNRKAVGVYEDRKVPEEIKEKLYSAIFYLVAIMRCFICIKERLFQILWWR